MEKVYKELDKVLEYFDRDIIERNKFSPHKYDIEERLSEKRLNEIIACSKKNESSTPMDRAGDIIDNDNRIVLDYSILYKIGLAEMVEEETKIKRKYSGFFWYPRDAFCGWHTNNNVEGERMYFTWAPEDNQSFFRYKDADTGEIITSWDKKGWQHRTFEVSRSKPCWHCVGSKTNRISIGLRVNSPNEE